MLMPKRVKHRRVHRGRMKGVATKGNTITYGAYAVSYTHLECVSVVTENEDGTYRIHIGEDGR